MFWEKPWHPPVEACNNKREERIFLQDYQLHNRNCRHNDWGPCMYIFVRKFCPVISCLLDGLASVFDFFFFFSLCCSQLRLFYRIVSKITVKFDSLARPSINPYGTSPLKICTFKKESGTLDLLERFVLVLRAKKGLLSNNACSVNKFILRAKEGHSKSSDNHSIC